jgi:ATP-binding cassette, subfamily B, bacterial HlyB/CyaB
MKMVIFLLIFDEATSALDYESESIIQANMRRISQGRTMFIIAHRLSAVKDANRIIVVDKGKLVEQGSHQQLIAHGGIYAQLYSIQNHHGVGMVAKTSPENEVEKPIKPLTPNTANNRKV